MGNYQLMLTGYAVVCEGSSPDVETDPGTDPFPPLMCPAEVSFILIVDRALR